MRKRRESKRGARGNKYKEKKRMKEREREKKTQKRKKRQRERGREQEAYRCTQNSKIADRNTERQTKKTTEK